MLQQLADTLKAQQLATVEATEQAKQQADGLKQVFREVRRNVAPPSIAIAEPEGFPMEDPREVPTGAPFILNPTAAMAQVGRKRNGDAHFAVPVIPANNYPNSNRTLAENPPKVELRVEIFTQCTA
jgi:hypothetical protein